MCLTEAGKLFCVPDFKEIKPCKLAEIGVGVEELPHCMAVIEPQYTVSGNVEVLLGVGSGFVIVDEDEVRFIDEEIVGGAVQKIAVSHNGRFLACFMHDGRFLVMNTEFINFTNYQCEVIYVVFGLILRFNLCFVWFFINVLKCAVCASTGADGLVWIG